MGRVMKTLGQDIAGVPEENRAKHLSNASPERYL
jgi:hypothetical protein